MKFKEYFKWLFTRWYFYVIAFLLIFNSLKGEDISQLINFEESYFMGLIFGSFVTSLILISIVYFMIKIIKKKSKR